jgi:hypothetical protein
LLCTLPRYLSKPRAEVPKIEVWIPMSLGNVKRKLTANERSDEGVIKWQRILHVTALQLYCTGLSAAIPVAPRKPRNPPNPVEYPEWARLHKAGSWGRLHPSQPIERPLRPRPTVNCSVQPEPFRKRIVCVAWILQMWLVTRGLRLFWNPRLEDWGLHQHKKQ